MVSATRPIVDNTGLMTQEFRSFINLMPQQGNGVPTHDAPNGVSYTDLDGTTGTRLYSSQGGGSWILV